MGLLSKCDICSKRRDVKSLAEDKLCKTCFEERYGKIILETDNGKYLEGYSDYSKKSGSLYLTQDSFIFVGGRGKNRWQMVIPLTSIDQNEWNYHKFEIPYLDETDKKQYPKFKIIQKVSKSGYLQWTEEINELILKLPPQPFQKNVESNEMEKLYQDLKDEKITIHEFANLTGTSVPTPEVKEDVKTETMSASPPQSNHKFCKACGTGISLGNQCKICKDSPFCDMCAERGTSMGRICNNCKTSHNLSCLSCDKLCEYQCVSCKNLHQKDADEFIAQSCQEHFFTLFSGFSYKNPYFHYCNYCGGQVCGICSIKKRMRKKRTCKNCQHELIIKYV